MAARHDDDDAFLFGGEAKGKQPVAKDRREVIHEDRGISAEEWLRQAKKEAECKKQGGGTKPKKLEVIDLSTLADNFMAPGRNRCTCQARRHRLLGNCMSCGRVICEQEGWGPCFFCGEPLMKKGAKLKGGTEAAAEAQAAANSHKDKLLSFQSSSAQRTSIVDDQQDYFDFDMNHWLSDKEREKKKQAAAKRVLKQEARFAARSRVTIDLAGRRVVTEVPEEDSDGEEEAEIATAGKTEPNFANPTLLVRPVYTGKAKAGGGQLGAGGGRKGVVQHSIGEQIDSNLEVRHLKHHFTPPLPRPYPPRAPQRPTSPRYTDTR